MKLFEVKAAFVSTGEIVNITGEWENWQAMEKELSADGYIVTWWHEVT